MRTESRCSHYRLDYPDVDYENWRAWINIYGDNEGVMRFANNQPGPGRKWRDQVRSRAPSRVYSIP